MRVDTLSYSYQMNVGLTRIFQVIQAEQERYFKSKGFSGESLREGVTVPMAVPSKLGAATIPATIQLSKLTKSEIELITSYDKGEIIQRYSLNELPTGKTKVTYSEKNTFTQMRNQYNFIFLAMLYKFSYNRGIKKRMKYLESQCE